MATMTPATFRIDDETRELLLALAKQRARLEGGRPNESATLRALVRRAAKDERVRREG